MLALAAFFLLGAVLGGMVAARGASAMGGELRRYLEGYLALRIEGAPSSAAVWQTMVCFFRASAAVFLLGFASVGVALIPAVCAAQGFLYAYSLLCFASGLGQDGFFLLPVLFALRLMLVLPCTLLLGSATAAGFSIAFFAPISRLSRAMKEVAGGNFRVHVETKSVFRDIRDSFDSFNLMVSELNATETLQTDFISNVSHEFKTPISAIEGYASLLQEHQQSPEEQAEYIDKILFNTRRLSALAGNILLLSKLDSQSIHPQRSRFRLDEQVRQCILALERKWTEKDIDFDVDLDSVDFTGYEGLLQHVWTNLIDNAVKFGPRGGLIRMRLIEEDGSVLFTIDNEGKSISDEDKSRIFNKFYQGDSSHESEGNGLGLALVRKIVAIHGGEVWVEDPVNGGCRFAVRLPVEK